MRKIKKFIKWNFLLILLGILGVGAFYLVAYINPKLEIKSANSFSFYDKNDNLFFTGNNNKEWVNIEDVSENLINATISIEDKYFYKHLGFDYLRIINIKVLIF